MKHQVQGGLLLNIVVLQGAAVLELLTRENQALLVRGNALLVLNLGLDSLDGVGALNLKSDGLAGECLHEDLHTSTQTKHQVQGGLLLNIVVLQGAAVLELLTRENQALLV